jgi:hypothetical protein
MKWLCVLAMAALGAACGGSSSSSETANSATAEATPSAEVAKAPEPPADREVTIPAGTTLRLDLGKALASDTSKVEDTVQATLRQDVSVDGAVVLPVGTELQGVVTGVERPGRVKGRAQISYRFDTLRAADETYKVKTSAIGHQGEATKSEDATKVGVGAGAGAVIGGILGGGDGAAKGAAIGGAAGTGAVLATRGKELKLAPGTNIATTLTAPLTVRIRG